MQVSLVSIAWERRYEQFKASEAKAERNALDEMAVIAAARKESTP